MERHKRILAYLFIAVLGFVVGIVLYYLGTLVGEYIIKMAPSIVEWFRNPIVVGAVLSGLAGAFLAVVLVYIWATRY